MLLNVQAMARDAKVLDEVRCLLRGTQARPVDSAVEAHHANSRSNQFAAGNDILAHEGRPTLIRNATVPVYVEEATRCEAGSMLTSTGALSVRSGAKTGRSPKDKRIVVEPSSEADVWWGPVNIRLTRDAFLINRERAIDYLNTRDRVFIVDGFAGWDPEYRISIRVICERAYHALFMRNMLIQPSDEELEEFVPDFTILNAGGFPANRYVEGITSPCSVNLDLGRNEMVILGTQYAGEMKKGILTLMMYAMPQREQLCLHSSANEGDDGRVTLFFGLSGTGKTTLSADPTRKLIGDDEHVWTTRGVFNVEGGCYAKCAHLTEAAEPDIYNAIRFGAVVENVACDPVSRIVDYTNLGITENTRCAYPLSAIRNSKLPATGAHPTDIILLTCDGFGVLPPVSRLSFDQVIYHFISGYTAKIAGTEQGVTEPTATFSACYGEPFLVFHPARYATMLAERLKAHKANAWLLNTGWVGGKRGNRCPLAYTRAIVRAIHSGALSDASYNYDPVFGLAFPSTCPDVPDDLLNPASSWADPTEFAATANELARLFNANFEKYTDNVSSTVAACAPRENIRADATLA